MSLSYSFAGKRVLITGGAQGIGRQLVQRFHDDNAIVFTIDKNPETIEQLKRELPKVRAAVADLTDWESTRKIIESFGNLDHVVNNAGIALPQPFMDVTKEKAMLQFDVNLIASINVIQTAAKQMIAQGSGGTMVNVSSFNASRAVPHTSVYGATKAAVEMLTKSVAVELASHNIRANCIAPGLVNNPLATTDDQVLRASMGSIFAGMPMKRPVETNELADLVMFLLSPLSAMVTGEVVLIDGGILAGSASGLELQ